MGDSFGHLFRITTWGESHGGGVGVVIDGCPSGLQLSEDDLQYELDRRRPGQSKITTQRKESDTARILSGVFEGRTTGTAISVMVLNEDAKSHAYEHLKEVPIYFICRSVPKVAILEFPNILFSIKRCEYPLTIKFPFLVFPFILVSIKRCDCPCEENKCLKW